MQPQNPVPRLKTAQCGPLHHVEEVILSQVATIEAWFRRQWQLTPPPITSSVDLRNAGFKLAPVDTNLFPAGFNNLNPDFMPLCVQAMQSVVQDLFPECTKILLIPESHSRNLFYWQSLSVLRNILQQAGFLVRVGSLDETLKEPAYMEAANGARILVEPVLRRDERIGVSDFDPCLVLLNNDLSSGAPAILEGIKQPVEPAVNLGWATRLKSVHFSQYQEVAHAFSRLTGMDPWFINPEFGVAGGVDFMAQEGLEKVAYEVDRILGIVREKYRVYDINETPYAVVKADNGTYGMSVMMVHDASEILAMNRKSRTRMSASKGSRRVEQVLIQEGVHTFETMPKGAVAEPVVYMLGQFVVGGFYRVHTGRGVDENLNAPGMQFEPLAFANPCNTPRDDLAAEECPNRFYAYGVIARLAALAAGRERMESGVNT